MSLQCQSEILIALQNGKRWFDVPRKILKLQNLLDKDCFIFQATCSVQSLLRCECIHSVHMFSQVTVSWNKRYNLLYIIPEGNRHDLSSSCVFVWAEVNCWRLVQSSSWICHRTAQLFYWCFDSQHVYTFISFNPSVA